MKKVHIKDICTKGSSALKQKDLLENGDYPVYGASGIAGYLNEYHQDKEYIAVVKDGSGIGRVSFQEPQSSVIGTMQYILPKEGYNIRYIGYCLQSLDLAGYKQGAAIPHIYFRDYGERLVNVTDDKAEQQAIVSRLDTAFAKIDAVKANAEKQLNDAKALFQKELSKAMTPKEEWEEKKVGEIFNTYAGGTPIKTHKEYYEGGDIPWIRSGEVCCKYITECEMFITEEGMNNSSAKYYPENTVLVAMYGATAAQVGILKFEATSNQAVCGILPHKDFVPEYVYYWFSNIQEELAAQAQGGAQPNISQIKIKNVVIPYAPLSEQQAIVSHLETLSEKLKTVAEKQKAIVAECDAMKQALLREVFA
jgi:type I restriction enzyme S subunit